MPEPTPFTRRQTLAISACWTLGCALVAVLSAASGQVFSCLGFATFSMAFGAVFVREVRS